MDSNSDFTFNISLSVLNHLGRNLYRNFATVLWEAISNSRDAEAENVRIYIDKTNNNFIIKDDWVWMSSDDFQNKFLKIGYSKRKDWQNKTDKGRPFIGRKGIWKLALLSCAERINIVSKKDGEEYIGWMIDNWSLDRAITDDLNPQEYPLWEINNDLFADHILDHSHGTIIYFEWFNDGVRNTVEFLQKLIALYFRFSLLDSSFNIYLNGSKITHHDLSKLWEKTEFLWEINDLDDPFKESFSKLKESVSIPNVLSWIKGFIASVEKPSELKIMGMNEKVGIDLFVNGRLRERDILKYIPSARIAESYLYWQIHYNDLDLGLDRFTTSREWVVVDDEKFQEFLNILKKKILNIVIGQWDKRRRDNREDWDAENTTISKKERKSRELYNAVSADYSPPNQSNNKSEVDTRIDALSEDAQYNFTSYAECFISENLIRRFIATKEIPLTPQAKRDIDDRKRVEASNKDSGNISIEIHSIESDLSYLWMDGLANLIDKNDAEASLSRDAKEYKPIRNAMAHTSLLTNEAKAKLTSVYCNIKARIQKLLNWSLL